MKQHIISKSDFEDFTITRLMASGPSLSGRKQLIGNLHPIGSDFQYIVEVNGEEVISTSDFDEAVEEYNKY